MRVLVVGSGGREHALCWKLAKEADVYCLPGNPGIGSVAELLAGKPTLPEDIVDAANRIVADLVVIGPEDPLVLGVADDVRAAGFPVYGPGRAGAQLEGSKAYAKDLMARAGVRTATFQSFQEPEAAKLFARQRHIAGFNVVVKASGNALGKGVIVCDDLAQADAAIEEMLTANVFGVAGSTIVVEDRLSGPEFSLLTVCSDQAFASLPVAQDYKRAFDADQGPNTGGMGSCSPAPWVDRDMIARTEEMVVAPVLKTLAENAIDFRGTLFSGILVHGGEPYCLEFNVRFGDPEIQSIVRRLGSGFADLLFTAASGGSLAPPAVTSDCAVTVVVASSGYPGQVQKGIRIELERVPDPVVLFHAGTALNGEGELVTAGGRVIAASALAPSIKEARQLAYQAAEAVRFEGAWYRKDIAESM